MMKMSSKSSAWGNIVYTDGEEIEADPIMVLIQKYEDLKHSKIEFLPNETLEHAKERRGYELYLLDKEIQDMIYLKRQKKMSE